MEIFTKQLGCALVCCVVVSATGNARNSTAVYSKFLPEYVFTRTITSLEEANFATEKMFVALREIVGAKGRVDDPRSKYEDIIYTKQINSFNINPEFMLHFTLEAALNYFVKEMLMAEPEEVAEISLEFHQWRDSALKQTKALQADKAIKNYREGKPTGMTLEATINGIAQIEKILTEFAKTDVVFIPGFVPEIPIPAHEINQHGVK